MSGRCFLVFLDFFLHPFKQILRYDSRDAIGNYYISVAILANIAAIFQNFGNAVDRMLTATVIANVMPVQVIPNLRHGGAFIIHLEYIQYKGGLDRVDLKMLLAVNQIANGGIASVELTLQSILCHATANLLRKISGEIFCKASRIDSIRMPSEESVMASLADTTRTPFFFRIFLYCALS